MYAQSHAAPWTQENGQEESYRPTQRLTHALLCWTLQIQWIHRNLHSL